MSVSVDIATVVAERILGWSGALITPSKSAYRAHHPRFVANANVIVGTTKAWYGDLDLDRSDRDLQALANETHETVHVLHEMDGRFGNEEHPLLDRPVASYAPNVSYTPK